MTGNHQAVCESPTAEEMPESSSADQSAMDLQPARRSERRFPWTLLLLGTGLLAVLGNLIYSYSRDDRVGPTPPDTTTINKVQSSLRRIADELSTSSTTAEDRNGNGQLDSGEDLNDNGRLDADWSISPTSITFNRIRPDGRFTLPITYRWSGDNLERTVTLTTSGKTRTAIIASMVSDFAITTSSGQITISLQVTVRGSKGSEESHSSRITVVPRQ